VTGAALGTTGNLVNTGVNAIGGEGMGWHNSQATNLSPSGLSGLSGVPSLVIPTPGYTHAHLPVGHTLPIGQPVYRGSVGYGQHIPVFTEVSHIHKAPIVHESFSSAEQRIIQPLIYRDVEKTEVHEVIMPMEEHSISAPQIVQETLPTKTHLTGNFPEYSGIFPTIQMEPIVEEMVHKRIIEEVQPVLYRETVTPIVFQQLQPILENIVEPPTILYDEIEIKEQVVLVDLEFQESERTEVVFQEPIRKEGELREPFEEVERPLGMGFAPKENRSSAQQRPLSAE